MDEVQLDRPPVPVKLLAGNSHREPKKLTLRCADNAFEKATIYDEGGAEMYTVQSKWGSSWSFRRHLYDATGKHIIDFRHRGLDIKNRWRVEDAAGTELAQIEHYRQVSQHHANVDLTFKRKDDGDADPDADVVVQMRQKDSFGITSYVAFKGATVAEITMTERNDLLSDLKSGKDWTVWKIRVASQFDLDLIAVMALCRAEMAHVWGR